MYGGLGHEIITVNSFFYFFLRGPWIISANTFLLFLLCSFLSSPLSLIFFCLFIIQIKKKKKLKRLLHWCSTLADPVDCNPPGSSVYETFQARILGWVTILFSRWFSQPRDQTQISCLAGSFFAVWATREIHDTISCTVAGCLIL